MTATPSPRFAATGRNHEGVRVAPEVERQARIFDTVLSSIADFAYCFDRDGRFSYINRALLDLWGLKLEEAVGKNFHDLNYPPELAAKLQRQIQQVFDTGRDLCDETPYTSPTGKGGYYEYIFAPVFATDGSVEMVAGSTRDITARKQVESELAEARRRLDSAVFAGEVGTFEWDVVRDRLWGDDNFARMFRIDRDPSGAAPLADYVAVIHPDDREQVSERLERTLSTGCDYEAEYRIVIDGQSRWVTARGKVECDGNGRVVRFPGVVLDISARKQAEQDLQESRRFLEDVVETSPALVVVSDEQGKILLFNRACEELTGYHRDAVLGRTIAELFLAPEWREVVARRFADPDAREVREPHVNPWLTRSGEQRWIEWRCTALPPAPGTGRRILGAGIDITQRKLAEDALRENEQKLRVALQAAALGTWSYTFADGRWELDERAQELYETGAPVVTHDEETLRRILHADDIPPMWQRVQEACDPTGDGRYNSEYRVLKPDGGIRWLRAWGQVLFEGQGSKRRPVRMIGSTRDVTQSKVAEEALRQAKEQAEQASAAKSEFLATLSHELRTPLTPVLFTVSLLEEHPALADELRGDIATIRRNIELESRLIGDLLDLTRIENGKLQLDVQVLDVHLILRSAIDICQRDASARLHLHLDAPRHSVRGDGTRLQQVFWNILNNAIKFTGPDGRITVRSSNPRPDRVRIEVTDTGIGIDAGLLPRLFAAFEQGEARSARQQAGLGLGLAISKQLIELHNGTITASSEGRGRGSTFTIELPAIASASSAPAPLLREHSAVRPLNVLLVEDHEATLGVLSRLLHRLGHRVSGVSSVAAATAAAERENFDLLICDLGLPDGSGLDVMRRLRGRFAGQAIALTGYGMESDIAASREAGFAEHLTKPVDLPSLQAAMRRVTSTDGA